MRGNHACVAWVCDLAWSLCCCSIILKLQDQLIANNYVTMTHKPLYSILKLIFNQNFTDYVYEQKTVFWNLLSQENLKHLHFNLALRLLFLCHSNDGISCLGPRSYFRFTTQSWLNSFNQAPINPKSVTNLSLGPWWLCSLLSTWEGNGRQIWTHDFNLWWIVWREIFR